MAAANERADPPQAKPRTQTPPQRRQAPTHISVWVGLALAAVGLLVALYAYTGTRVYDVVYAFVAIVGGILALAGILTAAWGRAVMAARAGRARRVTMTADTMKLAHEAHLEPLPPTVAEPASKKRFDFRATARRMMPERKPREERGDEKPQENGGGAMSKASSMFAFRAKAKQPSPPAPPAEAPVVVAAAPVATERVTLKCPQCGTQFSAEGVRPFTATCPQCAFAAEI